MSTIYAFEGPSGSGKGYQFSAHALAHPDWFRMDRPHLPREMTSWMGAWSSSFLEYMAISAAMFSGRDVLVDRFLFSRPVYRAMQFNNNQLLIGWRQDVIDSWEALQRSALGEASRRLGTVHLPVTANIMVLLPPLSILLSRRQFTNKEYPFDAKIESDLYEQIAEEFRTRPHEGIDVRVKICR